MATKSNEAMVNGNDRRGDDGHILREVNGRMNGLAPHVDDAPEEDFESRSDHSLVNIHDVDTSVRSVALSAYKRHRQKIAKFDIYRLFDDFGYDKRKKRRRMSSEQ